LEILMNVEKDSLKFADFQMECYQYILKMSISVINIDYSEKFFLDFHCNNLFDWFVWINQELELLRIFSLKTKRLKILDLLFVMKIEVTTKKLN
jgi:hypothetical protein